MHVRGHQNANKRILIQAATYNLALLMRLLLGSGTPKGLASRLATAFGHAMGLDRLTHALAKQLEAIVVTLTCLKTLFREPAAASLAA